MRAKPFARDAREAGPTWVRSSRTADVAVDLPPPVDHDETTTNQPTTRRAPLAAGEGMAVTEPYTLPRGPVQHEDGAEAGGQDDSITDAMELVLDDECDSSPVILHRPTFHTAPLHAVDLQAAAAPRRAPSLPPGPALGQSRPAPALDSLPDRVAPLLGPAIDPDSIDADDQSTGLFESDSNHTHAPPSMVDESRAFERPAAASTLSRSVAASIENEYVGMRAVPLEREPRPQASEVVDWPPPAARPTLDAPSDWCPDETRIVLDPRRSGSFALPAPSPSPSRWWVVAIDAAAWLLGFFAMFLTGLVTTGSAALVVFALSVS